jgi:hypothetical protein
LKKIKNGFYLNFDLISEIAVIPWFDAEKGEIFLIWYWFTGEKDNEGFQIPGWYKTREEANVELDRIMKGS